MSFGNGKVGITTIGPPGSGKSTLSRLIVPSLTGWKLHDQDDHGFEPELQRQGFQDISDAVKRMGDTAFLAFERDFTIRNYGRGNEGKPVALDNTIFASSGSLVRSPDAMEYVRDRTLVVLLDVPPDVVIEQISKRPGGAGRIIGMNGGPDGETPMHSSLRDELMFRQSLYNDSYDIRLSHRAGEAIEETADRFLKLIQTQL